MFHYRDFRVIYASGNDAPYHEWPSLSSYIKYVVQILLMKIEIEFNTGSVNASQISQKLSTIIDSINQQGLNSKTFGIEIDIGAEGGAQFPQKISSAFDSLEQQGLKVKECELEIDAQSASDVSQTAQKISSVVTTIKEQGFDVKEFELDAEKD